MVAGSHRATASFAPGGETRFTLPVANRKATHKLEITAELTATLNVPLPPMLQTTHHPARTDVYTRRVTCRCGESTTIKTVRIRVYHPEHVRAVETERAPTTRTRTETLVLATGVGADDPYVALYVPPPNPPAAAGGADHGGRFLLVELAVVGRITSILLAPGAALAALASLAAAPGPEERQMLVAFDAVLTGMAYAGVGLCLFAIVWAGFVLMAEGAEGQGRGIARNAVIMAVVGLVVVLLAKGIAAAINSRLIEVLPIP